MARGGAGSAERVWRERLRRYRRCELTVGEFCEREGVSPASFYAWRRRLAHGSKRRGENGGSRRSGQPLFLPVSVKSERVCEVRIELPSGAIVRLPEQADPRLLRSCIRAAADGGQDAEGEGC